MLENKKIFILGMARSGYHVAKLLASKNEIVIVDAKEQDPQKVQELENLNVKFILTSDPLAYFDDTFDILIKNPGVMPTHEVIKKAESMNIPVVNEMEVAYHYLPKNVTLIGVTGSNGKTTTTTIIYELLKKMNLPVILGGNIGYPLSEIIPKVHENDIVLLEVSIQQLYNFKDFKTNISVLTNICPTHLDYCGNYENYMNVKKKIFNNQTEDDIAIINNNNQDSVKITEDIKAQKKYFNSSDTYVKDDFIYIHNKPIIATKDILIKGMHNYENIMAALLVIEQYGLDLELIKDYFQTFKGVEHRIEFVLEKDGVKYYNDSKATNPTSTVVALKAFKNPVHLILGGMQRNQDFNELNDSLKYVKKIYAIGEVTDEIALYSQEQNIACVKCYHLNKAMEEIAQNVEPNDVVLLSPASASWDQYAKFEDRGTEFKEIVNS